MSGDGACWDQTLASERLTLNIAERKWTSKAGGAQEQQQPGGMYVHPELQNVTLSGYRVSENVIRLRTLGLDHTRFQKHCKSSDL